MSDIVERLRKWAKFGYGAEASNDMLEAARKIERLRDALDTYFAVFDEIERLRKALRLYQCQCEDGQCAVAFDDDERGELCGMPAIAALGEGKE